MTIPALGQFVLHARTAAPRGDRIVPAWAIVSAGLTPILLTGGWLVAGALQPASYDPIRDTVSVMAGHAGTDRWVMTGALLLVGGCHLVTAATSAPSGSRPGSLLILAGAVLYRHRHVPGAPGGLHSAASRLDLVRRGDHHSVAGFHGQARITAATDFEPPRLDRRDRSVSRPAVLAGGRDPGGSNLGMAERLTSSVQTSWPFVVAVVLWRHAARSRPPGLPGEPSETLDAQVLTPGALPGQRDLSVTAGLREQTRGAGFALGWAVLSNVPARITSRGFRAAADRATRRDGPTVRQLHKNLRRVVGPACPEEELDALVGAAMRSYARYWLETVHPGPPAYRQLRRGRAVADRPLPQAVHHRGRAPAARPGCSTASSPTGRASGWKCSR